MGGASTNNDSRHTGKVLNILTNTVNTDNTVSLEFANQNPEPGTWKKLKAQRFHIPSNF